MENGKELANTLAIILTNQNDQENGKWKRIIKHIAIIMSRIVNNNEKGKELHTTLSIIATNQNCQEHENGK